MSAIITIASLLYIAFLIRIAYKIIISYDDCNPIKASSWIFVIFLIPGLGLLMYIIMGRNLSKKKSMYDRLKQEADLTTLSKFGFQSEECSELPTRYHKLKKLLIILSHMPVFPGNQIDFYSNGIDKFKGLFADMEQAKDHIHILYYTFGGDETGQRFRDVIVKKRKEGVKVRLIYDDVGSDKTKNKFFKEMMAEGIEVAPFSKIYFPKVRMLQRINYRNHKKIVVIDGKIGYTGGMNVKNEYVKGLSWGPWRDLHMRIMGPAAQGLQAVFIVDWHFCTKELLNAPTLFPPVKNYGKIPLQVVTAEPLGAHRGIMEGMIQAISRAKSCIYIQTPYFVPTASIMAALCITALSGVKIIITIPRKSDNAKVQYAANSYLQQLLSNKIRVFQYDAGFIHSKLMIIDEELIIAGSSNMDIRSFELNFETSVFIYDPETAARAKEIFMRDLADSIELTEEEWNKRSKWRMFQDAFYRLFSPFL